MSVGPVPLAGGGIEVCYTNCICAMSDPVLPGPPSCGSCSQGGCGSSGGGGGTGGSGRYPVLGAPVGPAGGSNSCGGGGTCGGGPVLPMIAAPGTGGAGNGGNNCNCGNSSGGADPSFGNSGTGYSVFATTYALGLGTGICAEYMNASAGMMQKTQIACVPKPGQFMNLWTAKPIPQPIP